MQTSTLPIQVSGASAPNAPQRPNGNGDAEEFSAALSREIEQRNQGQVAAAPQPSPAQPAHKPQAASKPAETDAKAPVEEPGQSAETQVAAKPGTDDTAQPEETTQAPAAGEHPDHVTEMLALMASFNQPAQKAGAAGDAAGDVLSGADSNAQIDAGQFAALQAAAKRLAQDGGAAARGAGVPGESGAQRGPLPQALAGAERKGAATPAAGLLGAAETAVQAAPPAEGTGFSAQLVREAAAQAEAFRTAATPAPLSLAQVQQAMANAPQAAAAAGEYIAARVGTQAWDNQVGQKVVWMVAGGEQTASLTLNPPDLGPMQVVLSVTGDQASVAFSANQQEVRQALENALPRLREMMSESGISLGSATVGAGTSGQGQGEQAGSGARGGDGGLDNGTATADTAPRTARTTVLGDRGLVDTFA